MENNFDMVDYCIYLNCFEYFDMDMVDLKDIVDFVVGIIVVVEIEY